MKKIKLFLPHTHEDKEYKPGESIDLPDDAANWLVGLGAGEVVDPAEIEKTEGN